MEKQGLKICKNCSFCSCFKIDNDKNLLNFFCEKVEIIDDTQIDPYNPGFDFYPSPFKSREFNRRNYFSTMKEIKIKNIDKERIEKLIPIDEFQVPKTCPCFLEHALIKKGNNI